MQLTTCLWHQFSQKDKCRIFSLIRQITLGVAVLILALIIIQNKTKMVRDWLALVLAQSCICYVLEMHCKECSCTFNCLYIWQFATFSCALRGDWPRPVLGRANNCQHSCAFNGRNESDCSRCSCIFFVARGIHREFAHVPNTPQ